MRSAKKFIALVLLTVTSQILLLIIATKLGMLTFVSDVMATDTWFASQPISHLVVANSEISIAAATGLRMYIGKPFSGESVEYYPSGQLAKLESFEQGLRHGVHKQWFVHGSLAFDSQYVDGQLHGLTKSWWSNGNPRSVTPYMAGKVQGITEQRYASGEVFKKMHYVDGQ